MKQFLSGIIVSDLNVVVEEYDAGFIHVFIENKVQIVN